LPQLIELLKKQFRARTLLLYRLFVLTLPIDSGIFFELKKNPWQVPTFEDFTALISVLVDKQIYQ
jgi:hypothetical protein